MASVARRPDGRWRARYRDASGREHARHFERRIDADRWLVDQQSRVNRGEWVDPTLGKMTFGDWAETWVASKRGLKPTSRRAYQGVYKSLVAPRWASVPLQKVTYGEVVVWMAELAARDLSASRQRHALLVVKQILELAVFDGRLARNVASQVKAPRVRRGEPRFLSHTQLLALAQECQGYSTFVLLLGYTGLRWGEARALRVRHIDLLRSRLEVAENLPEGSPEHEVVAPKSHKRRTVPIPRFLSDRLAADVQRMSRDERVFKNSAGGVLDNSNFRRDYFDLAVSRLGLSPFTPHNLRDTAASLAVSAGANVKVVQRMLGHASAAMTLDTYAALFADDLDDVAARLNTAASAAYEQLASRHAGRVVSLP